MVIRVVSADGTVVRGTALAAHEPPSVDSAYFGPDLTARKFPASATWLGNVGAPLTPVKYQAGDWLVVELGTRAMVEDQGMGTSISINDSAASDLPLNQSETANLNSWIEILPPGSADEWLLGAEDSPHGNKTGRLESDPVNTATGNYTSSITDLALPGRGLPFAFTRTYNSLAYPAPDPEPPPNLVRFPTGGTASYTASRQYSAVYAPQYAADGQASNTSGGYATWAVNGWQSGDWWQVSWSQPQAVDRVVLCDRRASGYYFGSAGRLTFSDGSTVNWSGLPNDCGSTGANTLTIEFPRKTGITWMRVVGDTGGGGNAGLAEVFAYDVDGPNAAVRDYPSALGVGWTHSYAAHLGIDPVSGQVTFHAEDGSLIRYAPDGSGGYVAPPNIMSSLAAVTGGGYELTRRDAVRYRFDASGLFTAMIDRNGNQLSFAYTGANLTTITDTVGRSISLAYTNGRLTSVSGPPTRTISYGYDSLNRLTSVTDARGKAWTYTYDTKHRLVTVVDPNNHTVVTNEYGTDGRISAQTDARGKRGTFTWNEATETSTYTDSRGKAWVDVYATNVLQSSSDPLGNTTSYAYDGALNLTAVTDPRGKTTTMTYDGADNLLTRTAPTPLSYVETWTYTIRNDVATYTNGRDNTTTYAYDTAGNLTKISEPLGVETEFARDPAGTGLLTSLTDPRDKVTTYGHDAEANLSSVTTPQGNQTTMTYDDAGRLVSIVEPRGNQTGADPADFETTFTYDGTDHVLTTTDPLGHVTESTYDPAGNLASVTDANDHTTAYGYDAANHLTSVTDALDGVTAYSYDDAANLVSRTDANDHVTTHAYDDANRLTSTTDPLDHVWRLTYDDAGNVATRTDANEHVITYAHDELNRLTGIAYADPSTPDVTMAYDANHNLTTMTDGAGTETYAYDDLDRLESVTRGTNIFSYAYDPASNITSRIYPDSTVTTYTYDDDGRMATAVADGATTTYGYDAAGNLTTVATPDAYVARHAYDRAGRLLEIAHRSDTDLLSRFTYQLDAAGNRTAVTSRLGTVSYRYDELNRLTGACWDTTCPWGAGVAPAPCLDCGSAGGVGRPADPSPPDPADTFQTFTYDPVGNRLTEVNHVGTTTYAYDDADRLTARTPPGEPAIAYTYDDNGNQLTSGADTFAWDAADRLVSAIAGGASETYSYAGDGRRLSVTAGPDTTSWWWDLANPLPMLALERDGGGAVTGRSTYGLGRIATLAFGQTAYHHADGLGSVVDLTDPTGDPLGWSEYQPFGAVRTSGLTGGAPALPFGFTGEFTDATALVHLRARQYDATIGRFLSIDPLMPTRARPHLATYVYAIDNPMTYVDPEGTLPFLVVLGGLVVSGIVGYVASNTATNVIDNYQHDQPLTHDLGRGLNPADTVISGASGLVGGPLGGVRVAGMRMFYGAGIGAATTVISQEVAGRDCMNEARFAAAAGAVTAAARIKSWARATVFGGLVSVAQGVGTGLLGCGPK